MLGAQCTVRPVESLPTCPACGGPLVAWRSLPASDPSLGGARFELARCSRCGSAVTLGAVPAGLHESGAYRPGAPRLHAVAGPVLRLFDRQRLALVRSLAPPAGAAAGCGRRPGPVRGRCARCGLRRARDRAVGARRRSGRRCHVERARIEDGADRARLGRRGDAVARARAPRRPRLGARADLGLAAAAAAASLVGVPNLASLQARVGGERWYHLDVPRHRVHYTPAGLEALLRSHGFAPAGTRHVLLEHNPFGMWQSLVSRFTRQPSYLYNLLKRNAPLRSPDLAITLAALPLAPLAAALELLAGARRTGRDDRDAGAPSRLTPARSNRREARSPTRLPLAVWKEVASADCSGTRTTSSGGSASSPSRCRARSASRGPTTRSSSRST